MTHVAPCMGHNMAYVALAIGMFKRGTFLMNFLTSGYIVSVLMRTSGQGVSLRDVSY